jgi:hypothetical protein
MRRASPSKMREPIRQPLGRLTGQPEERQYSARVARSKSEGDAGTRGRLPPARGSKISDRSRLVLDKGFE